MCYKLLMLVCQLGLFYVLVFCFQLARPRICLWWPHLFTVLGTHLNTSVVFSFNKLLIVFIHFWTCVILACEKLCCTSQCSNCLPLVLQFVITYLTCCLLTFIVFGLRPLPSTIATACKLVLNFLFIVPICVVTRVALCLQSFRLPAFCQFSMCNCRNLGLGFAHKQLTSDSNVW